MIFRRKLNPQPALTHEQLKSNTTMKHLFLLVFFLFPVWGYGQFGEGQFVQKHYAVDNYQIGDFDVDGDMDIIAFNDLLVTPDILYWFENLDGQGNFGPAQSIGVGPRKTPVATSKLIVTDINLNGVPDVLVPRYGFMELDTNGVFQLIIPSPDEKYYENQLTDIDGDGDLDILFTKKNLPIAGYKFSLNQDGLGDFSEPEYLDVNNSDLQCFVSINFENDNDKDFALIGEIDYYNSYILTYENEGDLPNLIRRDSFSAVAPATRIKDIAVGDFNGDGFEDLISLETDVTSTEHVVLRLNDSVEFDSLVIYISSFTYANTIQEVEVWDVDLDNDLDIVLEYNLWDDTSNLWLENRTVGNNIEFVERSISHGGWLGENTRLRHLRAADLNNDGKRDFIAKASGFHTGLYWLENLEGVLEFDTVQAITNHLTAYSAHSVGDVDNDGDVDILAASDFLHSTTWYENNGEGIFSDQQPLIVHDKPIRWVQSHDVSGDSLLDIIVSKRTEHQEMSDILLYRRNNINDGYDPPVLIENTTHGSMLFAFGDLDGDGVSDVCGLDSSAIGQYIVNVYKNIGDGSSFQKEQVSVFSSSLIPKKMLLDDIDGDGDNDFCCSTAGDIYFFENIDGNGAFAPPKPIVVGCDPTCVFDIDVADIDNDNDIDIGVIISGDIWVYRFDQNTGTFDLPELILDDTPQSQSRYFEFIDIDNNGDMDIVYKGGWLYNVNGQGSFSTHLHTGFNLFNSNGMDQGDFNDDGLMDISAHGFNIIQWHENTFDRSSIIKGRLFKDENENCLLDSLQDTLFLANWLVEIRDSNQSFFVNTNKDGYYATFAKDTGEYTLSLHYPNPYWEGCFDDSLIVVPEFQETYEIDLPAIAFIECPIMEVDIANSYFRPCIPGSISVHYANTGTATAEDATVEILIDSLLDVTSSSTPWSIQTDSSLIFELGDLSINESGTIQIDVLPMCDPDIVGELACNVAMIEPDTLCIPTGSNWDESSIEVTGYCDGDSVVYQIENLGYGGMSEPRIFALEVIINDEIVLLEADTFELEPNEIRTLNFEAQGDAMRLEAEQDPEHPVATNSSDVISGCGMPGSMPSPLIPFYLPSNAGVPTIAEACRVISGSYDPNFKEAFPIGIGEDHLIEGDEEFEYIIHFQNTGNDTAFNIVIKDTLSLKMDLATLRTGAASHPFSWELTPDNELIFSFGNILLPDSTTNEVASHGYVQYFIYPKEDMLPGTVIENRAGIYFDINDPIITNTVFHTIRKPVNISVQYGQWCEGETLAGQTIASDTLLRDSFVFLMYDSIAFYYVDMLPAAHNQADTAIAVGQLFLNVPIEQDTVLVDTLVAANGCDSLVVWQVSVFTNSNSTLSKSVFRLYPNPSEGEVFLETGSLPSSGVIWRLKDSYGRELMVKHLREEDHTKMIDLSHLTAGMYWYEYVEDGYQLFNGKLVIRPNDNY